VQFSFDLSTHIGCYSIDGQLIKAFDQYYELKGIKTTLDGYVSRPYASNLDSPRNDGLYD